MEEKKKKEEREEKGRGGEKRACTPFVFVPTDFIVRGTGTFTPPPSASQGD